MALVDEDERVVGEVLEQRRRRLARLAAGQVARIVLDAGAGAGRLDHLEVELRALLEPLRLEQPARRRRARSSRHLQLLADALDRLLQRRLRRHVVRVGVDLDALQVAGLLRRSADRTPGSTRSRRRRSEMRQARSSRCAGKSSSVSPRTRKRAAHEIRCRCACTAARRGRRNLALVDGERRPPGRRSSPCRSRPSRCRRCRRPRRR